MEKFQLPEDISTLSLEGLRELRAAAKAAIDEHLKVDDAEFDADYASSLAEAVDAIDSRIGEVEAADAARVSARERLAAIAQEPEAAAEAQAEVEDQTQTDDAADAGVEAEASVEEEERELVTASAGTRRPTVAQAFGKAPTVIINADKDDDKPEGSRVTILAAAGIPQVEKNTELDDMARVADAFLAMTQRYGYFNSEKMKAGVYKMSPRHERHAVATIKRDEREFAVDASMSLETQFSIIMEAAREQHLSGGTVLAAGGWCAPSETMYGFCELETLDGLIDVPEVTARRGGIQFTKGPDFMTIFGDPDAGWIMTEAEVEAGEDLKPCYAVECPPFTEVRLDAIGFCATAGLLTNAAYPELVRRVLNLIGIGHARRKSAETIARISTAIGAAVNWTEVGGGLNDVLGALELQAMRIRQSLAMSPTATIEAIGPYWYRAAARFELSRRLGLPDPFNVTDADVDHWLAVRGIRVQWVYDYQMLAATGTFPTVAPTATWTEWPANVEFMLYPAGAFVRLVNDVISLDVVHDHDMLTRNEYTAGFMEEGIAIANTCGFGVKVQVALNYDGTAGFPAIGAGEGVTFAAA